MTTVLEKILAEREAKDAKLQAKYDRLQEMARLHTEEGMSYRAIGAKYGMSGQAVHQFLAQYLSD